MTGTKRSDNLNGMMFSTKDRDNDNSFFLRSCADNFFGGWWFNFCHDAYLNGRYGSALWKEPWTPTVPSGTLVRETVMMVKRK
jgi:hypothetical protein